MKYKYCFWVAVVILITGTTSCRKIYTCSCTANETTTVTSFNYEHKGNVNDYCDQMQAAAQIEDPSATCKVDEALNQQP